METTEITKVIIENEKNLFDYTVAIHELFRLFAKQAHFSDNEKNSIRQRRGCLSMLR